MHTAKKNRQIIIFLSSQKEITYIINFVLNSPLQAYITNITPPIYKKFNERLCKKMTITAPFRE